MFLTANARSSVMSIYNPWCGPRCPGAPACDAVQVTACNTACQRASGASVRHCHSIMFHYEKAWQEVMARIARAARAAGRDPAGIRLLAVSKTFPRRGDPRRLRARPAGVRRELRAGGCREDRTRSPTFPSLEWHLIGPLQSNKAAMAAQRFAWVHTVDRLKIAERLSAARSGGCAAARRLRAGQRERRGVEERRRAGEAVRAREGRRGAAAPAPARDHGHPRADRRHRAAARRSSGVLRECLDACRAAGLPVDTLSMGMSADLEDAIAEGATLVRVGTAIFGARRNRAVASSGILHDDHVHRRRQHGDRAHRRDARARHGGGRFPRRRAATPRRGHGSRRGMPAPSRLRRMHARGGGRRGARRPRGQAAADARRRARARALARRQRRRSCCRSRPASASPISSRWLGGHRPARSRDAEHAGAHRQGHQRRLRRARGRRRRPRARGGGPRSRRRGRVGRRRSDARRGHRRVGQRTRVRLLLSRGARGGRARSRLRAGGCAPARLRDGRRSDGARAGLPGASGGAARAGDVEGRHDRTRARGRWKRTP